MINNVKEERIGSPDMLLRFYLKFIIAIFRLYKLVASYAQILEFEKENNFFQELFFENLYFIPGKT